jgi:hypothetical protein
MVRNALSGGLGCLFALFLIAVCGFSQQPGTVVTEQRQSRDPEVVFNSSGWEIPAYRIKSDSVETRLIGGRNVIFRSYSVKKNYDVNFDLYWVDENSAVHVESRSVEVVGVTTAEIEGKIFEKYVSYATVGVAENGSKAYGGRLINVFYFDDDGDGIFESRYDASRPFEKLPKWATK